MKRHYENDGMKRRAAKLSPADGTRSPTASGPTPARRVRRTQVERSAETRQKLIDAAIQIVHESGFSRLTVSDVARRAGLTSGAVQHHFASSRDLIRAVSEAVFPVFQLPIEDVGPGKLSLEQRVHRLVDIYWSLYRLPEYLVFWELLFGTRNDREVRDVLISMQKEMVAAAVADLVRLFSDVRLRRPAAFNLWTFITSQLRGLALLSIFEDQNVLDGDVRFLKDATYHLFLKQTQGSRTRASDGHGSARRQP